MTISDLAHGLTEVAAYKQQRSASKSLHRQLYLFIQTLHLLVTLLERALLAPPCAT
jgi:hypothetical protein